MKNIKKYNSVLIILVLVLFFSQLPYLNGQVNIEKQRKDITKDFVEASLGFSLSLYKGNTNLFRFNTDLRLDFRKGKNSGFLMGNLAYGEKSEVSYIDKGFVHLRFIRDISGKFLFEAFLQKEFNDFLLLEKRELAGLGLRFHLINQSGEWGKFNIHLGMGMMYEIERFNPSSDLIQKEDSSILKSTNYISIDYISKKFSIKNVTYFQSDFGKDSSSRITSDLKFSVKLSKLLSYTAGINYRYDSNPAPTVKNYDLQIVNGLKVLIN